MMAGALIREARLRSGLTQTELATRLATTQSAVARWEGGAAEPRCSTVVRAVRACGLELVIGIAEADRDHDRLIGDYLRLTPAERLADLEHRLDVEAMMHAAVRT